MRLIGRLPGYDTIVSEVSETTLRVIIEMLRGPADGRAGQRPAAQQHRPRSSRRCGCAPTRTFRPRPRPTRSRRGSGTGRDPAPAAAAPRPRAAAEVQAAGVVGDRAAAGRGADHRGPAADREAAYAARRRSTTPTAPPTARCRWRGPGRRSRDVEFHPAILRDVSTVDTSREVLGARVGAAVRDRADRVHPDDADRGRDRRRHRRRRRPASRSRCRRWAPPRSRTSRRRPRTAATGSSSTCGRTATGRWRWSTGPRRPATTRCW